MEPALVPIVSGTQVWRRKKRARIWGTIRLFPTDATFFIPIQIASERLHGLVLEAEARWHQLSRAEPLSEASSRPSKKLTKGAHQ